MLRKNERQLLYLISLCGRVPRLKLVKTMFLVSQKTEAYNFVPYKWGPYSFLIYHDLLHLEREGYIHQDENDVIYHHKEFPHPDPYLEKIIERSKETVFKNDDYIDNIYTKYPEYTIFSNYKRLQEYKQDKKGINTIGYEGRDIDTFLSILIKNKVTLVVDVRKNAYSMKYGFSMSKLALYLEKMNIKYIHMPELGIESQKRKSLKTDRDYNNLFIEYRSQLDSKKAELKRLIDLSKEENIALLCFEADPKKCHRGVIADELRRGGIDVEDL